MNAYEHLQVMCSPDFVDKVKNTYYSDPISPRLAHIMSQVKGGRFDQYQPPQQFFSPPVIGQNYYVTIKCPNPNVKDTIVFMAHHDVVNINSQNCNDNTASVCHLMALCERLRQNQQSLKCNVIVGFVDLEETCSTVLAGSSRFGDVLRINAKTKGLNVIAVYNLELTSVGQHYWYNPYGPQPHVESYLNSKSFTKVFCPLNDAYHINARGVPAVCIGSVRSQDLEIINSGRCGCELWASCHSNTDTMEKWANPFDMQVFTDELYSLATDYPYVPVDNS